DLHQHGPGPDLRRRRGLRRHVQGQAQRPGARLDPHAVGEGLLHGGVRRRHLLLRRRGVPGLDGRQAAQRPGAITGPDAVGERVLAGGLRRRDLRLRRCAVQGLDGRHAAQQAGGGHGPLRRRLPDGRRRRRHLLVLRQGVPRLAGRQPAGAADRLRRRAVEPAAATAGDQPQPLPWNSCSTEQCGRLPNFLALAHTAAAWLSDRPPLKISASQFVAEIFWTWVLNPSFLAAAAIRVASAPLLMCPPRIASQPDEDALAGDASAPTVMSPATAAPITRRAAPRYPPAVFTVASVIPSFTDFRLAFCRRSTRLKVTEGAKSGVPYSGRSAGVAPRVQHGTRRRLGRARRPGRQEGPVVAAVVQREAQVPEVVLDPLLAVGVEHVGDEVLLLAAAGADHELPDAGGVGGAGALPALGPQPGEALIGVVVAREDDVGPGLLELGPDGVEL